MANEDASKRASVEVHFAQRLAANEKKIRDRAMKKLKKWLEVKSLAKKDKAFTQEDFLKIWKGLHYCLWMQDKPLLQEEMSAFISRLVHVFSHPDTTLLFIEVFLETEAREWHGIDRWRMDKFMMLFRNVITQSLEFLKKQKWKKSLLSKFGDVLSSKIMTTSEGVPDGLKIHLADLYLDELEKVGANELSSDKVLILLEPFLQFTQNSRNLVIVERIINRVFDAVIQQTVDDAIKAAEKQIENEDSDEEADVTDEDDDIPVRLQFDFKALADRLFQLGSSKDCVSKNRNMIYTLVKKFKDLEEGILPVEPEDEEAGDVLTKKDFSLAVQDFGNMDAKLSKKKRQRKKKKNKKVAEEDTTENLKFSTESNTSPKDNKAKKGKRKIDDKTKNTDTSPPKKKKGMKEEKGSSENMDKDTEINDKSLSPSVQKSNKKGNKQTTMHIGLDTLALKRLHDSQKVRTEEECEENLNNSNIMQKKGKNKKKVKKIDVVQDAIDIKGDNSENSDESMLWEDNSEQSVATSPKLRKNKARSDRVVSSSSKPTVKVDNKKKRKSSQISETQNNILTPVGKKTPKEKKNKVEDENSPKSAGFAKFDKLLKTPPAFVKKAVSKVSTPKQAVKQKTPEAPSTCPEDPRKKVIFNMKRNKSLSFQESIQFSPGAFNPRKQPDHGIMKTPSPAVTRSKSVQKKGKRRASTGGTRRPQAADFF